VTEGEKTEPNYFIKLRDRFHLSVADVIIHHPAGTDPITLTKRAIELRDVRQKEVKQGSFDIAYDEVWVVFDLEKPNDQRRDLARQAMTMKGASGIRFAVSDPAFEYWLLLHEKYTTSPFNGCDDVIKRLRRYWPDYAKAQVPSDEFIKKIPTAVVNAERCRAHHEASGGEGNPSTKVDILVRSLNGATREHFRFSLGEQKVTDNPPSPNPPSP